MPGRHLRAGLSRTGHLVLRLYSCHGSRRHASGADRSDGRARWCSISTRRRTAKSAAMPGLPYSDQAGLTARMREAFAMSEPERDSLSRTRAAAGSRTLRLGRRHHAIRNAAGRPAKIEVSVPQPARCYVEISRSALPPTTGPCAMPSDRARRSWAWSKPSVWARRGGSVARSLPRRRPWLAVSSVEEGIALRDAGIDCRILVMAGVMPWEREALREYHLTPVVHSLDELRSIATTEPASRSTFTSRSIPA